MMTLKEFDSFAPDINFVMYTANYIADDKCGDFNKTFGHNTGFSMNDVLWTCSNMFSKR